MHPALKEACPYIVAVIELPDAGNVRDNARIPGSVAIAQIRMTVRQARRGARGFRSGALRHSAGDRNRLRIAGSSERVDENRASEDGSHAR